VLEDEELQARRDARRRRRTWRRRRRRALVVVALSAAAVAVAVVAGGASQRTPRRRAPARAATSAQPAVGRHRHHHRHRADSRTGLVPGAGRDATVPILMYHVIAPAPANAPFPMLYVTREEFTAQMEALHRAGWTAVTMDQVWAAWMKGRRLPPGHPIVISFDNGYSSQYHNALPVLRHLGWVGVENIQLTGLPRSQGGLSRKAVRRLVAAGWELDTQGYSHADLVAISAAQLRHEVIDARRTVQRRWHVPVHWFCFPSGHYDARVLATVRTAGYVGATTVVPGWASRADDPYRLPRLRVVAGTTPRGLLAQIAATRHDPPAPPAYGVAG
jgi:peptidoglycan/xylan/chitin deacetylase (PgdA/CDA1 family)